MRKNKGFTLAELLIVVAIIAVLVAIAIPIFSAQLEKAKEATDVANIRSAYAEVTAAYITDGGAHSAEVEIKSNTGDWKSEDGLKVAGVAMKEVIGSTSGITKITVSVDASGVVKIADKTATSSFIGS